MWLVGLQISQNDKIKINFIDCVAFQVLTYEIDRLCVFTEVWTSLPPVSNKRNMRVTCGRPSLSRLINSLFPC